MSTGYILNEAGFHILQEDGLFAIVQESYPELDPGTTVGTVQWRWGRLRHTFKFGGITKEPT